MPSNANGVAFQNPITISSGSLTPRLVSADVSLPTTPFFVEAARNLFARLNTHEFAAPVLTGSNNDLVFIARLAGDQNVAIQYSDPGANNASIGVAVRSFLTTALTGTNNDLTYEAVATGGGTSLVTIAYVDPAGNNAAESVTVSGTAITVHLATGSGGAITSTGATILASIRASAAASALVTVALAVDNDGTGAVTALTATALSGNTVVVSLATGPTGTITSTAAQVKAAIEASTAAALVMVVALAASNDGTGVVTALGETPLLGPTGTLPTLDVTLKHGDTQVAADLVTHSAFAQKTTATTEFKTFSVVAPYAQWLFDVGGTTPVFAVSLTVSYNPN